MSRLAMFPLGTVLLTGEVLPLNVFEPRYRAMVGDCLRSEAPGFGVVLIDRGSEVGGGDIRRDVAVLARVLRIEPTPIGTLGVWTVGAGRIRVNSWLADDPYPVADVDPWPDDPVDAQLAPPDAEVIRRLAGRAIQLGAALGDLDASSAAQDIDEVATEQLYGAVGLGPADRYDLLCAAGPNSRSSLFVDQLEALVAQRSFRLGRPSSPDAGHADPT